MKTKFGYKTIFRFLTSLCMLCMVFMLVPMAASAADGDVEINETNFPDAAFRSYITANVDEEGDGILSAEEIASVTSLTFFNEGIEDLKGIEYFTALTTLTCSGNQLTSLDVSNNIALTTLHCFSNRLTSLDVSNCNALEELICTNNQLTSLKVSDNIALKILLCENNQLEDLDVSNNPALMILGCSANPLTDLDVRNAADLEYLYCSDSRLDSLDVSNNPALTELHCNDNQLTALDVSNNPALTELNCSNNRLTSLDLSNNTALTEHSCEANTYEIQLGPDRSFDLSRLPEGFDVTKASQWQGGTVAGSILTVSEGTEEVSYTYDLGNGQSEAFALIVTTPVASVFTDVAEGSWYEDAVQYVYDKGLMEGNGDKFTPNGQMTRGMFVTTLYRLAGEPKVTDRRACTELHDVAENAWYTDAVCWAYANEITTGYLNDMTFRTNVALSREQLATFVYRYAQYQGLETDVSSDLEGLLNADKVKEYAIDGVKWAVGAGIISGMEIKDEAGNTVYDLAPQKTATRSQMAQILRNFCEAYQL